MIEVDARVSGSVLITLCYDPLTVTLCDEYSSRTLVPKDRAEAIEMFKHPFAYSHRVNVLDQAQCESDLAERIAAY